MTGKNGMALVHLAEAMTAFHSGSQAAIPAHSGLVVVAFMAHRPIGF
jgi:hypothetical protein